MDFNESRRSQPGSLQQWGGDFDQNQWNCGVFTFAERLFPKNSMMEFLKTRVGKNVLISTRTPISYNKTRSLPCVNEKITGK